MNLRPTTAFLLASISFLGCRERPNPDPSPAPMSGPPVQPAPSENGTETNLVNAGDSSFVGKLQGVSLQERSRMVIAEADKLKSATASEWVDFAQSIPYEGLRVSVIQRFINLAETPQKMARFLGLLNLTKTEFDLFAGSAKSRIQNFTTAEALEAFEEFPEQMRPLIASGISEQAGRELNLAAFNRLNTGGPENSRLNVLAAQFLSGAAGSDISKTYSMIRDNSEFHSVKPDQAPALIAYLVSTNPSKNIGLIQALPETMRPEYEAAFFNAWFTLDSYDLSEKIRAMPPGSTREAAIRTLVKRLDPVAEADEIAAWKGLLNKH